MLRYLPSLSTLISVKDLPESLGFLQNAVDSIFDDVYFVYKEKAKGLAVYPARKTEIKELMNLPEVFNHYKINQISL